VKEEEISQAARTEDTDNLAGESREISGYEIWRILIAACHHWSPDLRCETQAKSPEDDRGAAKLVREREPDKSTGGQASGGG
jgi:hypothetical protein